MISFLKNLFGDKDFLKRTWEIVLPVTIYQALATLTNVVDNVMIGQVGEIELGGVGLASKVFFVVCLAVFGVSSGMSVLASQYWGNNDIENIRKVVGLGAQVSLAFAFIATSFCYIMPDKIMSIMTDSPELIKAGSDYLRIQCFTYPLLALSGTFISGLRSMDVAKPAIYISIVSILVNVFFNWIFIFGHLGCPAMGVEGAAIATVIARFAELILTILALRIVDSPLWCHPKHYFRYSPAMLNQFWTQAMTVVVNDTLWGLGYSVHAITYGRMGETTAAAYAIISIFSDIEVVALLGLSTATAVILGNELGAGNLKKAKVFAKYYIALGFMVGVCACLFTLAIRQPIVSIYNLSDDAAAMTIGGLTVLAISFIWRADNNITIVGILRAGGDTKACALIDLLPMWLVTVPLVPICGLKFCWPFWAVYLINQSDEFIKLIVSLIRVSKKKWVRNLNVELEAQL